MLPPIEEGHTLHYETIKPPVEEVNHILHVNVSPHQNHTSVPATSTKKVKFHSSTKPPAITQKPWQFRSLRSTKDRYPIRSRRSSRPSYKFQALQHILETVNYENNIFHPKYLHHIFDESGKKQ